ncbi:chaperone SurA [Desulfomarina profundi]|uniref:Chaperone SurA n=1 Tax=Desulfomarina profundi TaxID=2772557 RepID=A0A8D5FUY4_9BACT|nr:SurA N-terminal domain-containing protein [Desulfomarina profundi]BCL61826.1 chaperone SurA [Desulfomarina profundi]
MHNSQTIPLFKVFFFIFFFSVLCLKPVSSRTEVIDKVVAVVNDDIITLSEVEQEAEGLYRAIAQKNSGDSLLLALDKAREKTLDALIDKKLIIQKAKQFHVSVSQEEIDKAYEKVRARAGLDKTTFKKKLKESGMTEKMYRSNLETRLLQKKLISYDVRSKVVITEAMIVDYFDEHYTKKVKKGSFYLLQIGFTWDETGDPQKETENKEHALRTAERVHKLALSGQKFRKLAKKFSSLPSASDGGDIGIFTLDEMAPAMRKAVADLEPGAISDIVKIGSSFQFFKLLSGNKDAIIVTASYEDVKEEIKQKLYEKKLKEAYSDWVKKLKEKAYIRKL